MFTGIIEAVGRVLAREDRRGDARLRVASGGLDLGDVRLGDSIAVNGVCLTAVELPGDGFWADVSAESLSRTTLGALRPGDPVNLEKALTPTSRLGGHMVAGHVDGVGRVLERRPERLIERVVWGMLPKTKLGRDMYRKLKVYAGPSHPHAAQKPAQID